MQVSNYLDKRVPSTGKKNIGLDSNIALLHSITYSYMSPNNIDSVNKGTEDLFSCSLCTLAPWAYWPAGQAEVTELLVFKITVSICPFVCQDFKLLQGH